MAAQAHPHILIVDDDPALRLALATALRMSCTVRLAATGADALACVEQHKIDGVILDVRLARAVLTAATSAVRLMISTAIAPGRIGPWLRGVYPSIQARVLIRTVRSVFHHAG